MNRLTGLFFFAIFLISCAGTVKPIDPFTPSPDCNAELDKITAGKPGVSLIRAKIPNPCDAHRICVTAAKAGVVWDAYTVDELIKWAEATRKLTIGISYDNLKLLLAKEIKTFNANMGGTFLLLSELVIVLDGSSPISAPDQAILDEGWRRLIDEAKMLALLVREAVPCPS